MWSRKARSSRCSSSGEDRQAAPGGSGVGSHDVFGVRRRSRGWSPGSCTGGSGPARHRDREQAGGVVRIATAAGGRRHRGSPWRWPRADPAGRGRLRGAGGNGRPDDDRRARARRGGGEVAAMPGPPADAGARRADRLAGRKRVCGCRPPGRRGPRPQLHGLEMSSAILGRCDRPRLCSITSASEIGCEAFTMNSIICGAGLRQTQK